jgi:hypothetical protein
MVSYHVVRKQTTSAKSLNKFLLDISPLHATKEKAFTK